MLKIISNRFVCKIPFGVVLILFLWFPCHLLEFILVSIEDASLTPSKVCVDLAWQEGILGNVRIPRVLIEW